MAECQFEKMKRSRKVGGGGPGVWLHSTVNVLNVTELATYNG